MSTASRRAVRRVVLWSIGLSLLLTGRSPGVTANPVTRQATPALIRISGDTLPAPIFLTDSTENAVIVSSLGEAAQAATSGLESRPSYDVAMYMRSRWLVEAMADSASLNRVPVDRADWRGRLYRPVDGLEALYRVDAGGPAGSSAVRRVGVPGLRALRRHGIALRSPE